MASRESTEAETRRAQAIEAQTRLAHGLMYNIWKGHTEEAKETDKAYRELVAEDIKADHPRHDLWVKQVELSKRRRAFYTFIANAWNPDNLDNPAVFLENVKKADGANTKAGAVMVELLDMIEDLADNGPGVWMLEYNGEGPPTRHHNGGAHIEFATMIKEAKEAQDNTLRAAYRAHGTMTETGFVDRA